MHESGQCGSPPPATTEDCSRRCLGKERAFLASTCPISSSSSLHSPALDSEHMPKRIRAALICTQCEIQLGMPQVQPEAPQQWQEMTKKKTVYNLFSLPSFMFSFFLFFVASSFLAIIGQPIQPTILSDLQWIYPSLSVSIPVDHFSFRATLQYLLKSAQSEAMQIVSHKDPK